VLYPRRTPYGLVSVFHQIYLYKSPEEFCLDLAGEVFTKILLYKTLIRPVASYGAETWTMTKKEEKALLIFEMRIFRRIYGPKYENGEWKSRTNRELEEINGGENIVKWKKMGKG
jgi:hypothetical protein